MYQGQKTMFIHTNRQGKSWRWNTITHRRLWNEYHRWMYAKFVPPDTWRHQM